MTPWEVDPRTGDAKALVIKVDNPDASMYRGQWAHVSRREGQSITDEKSRFEMTKRKVDGAVKQLERSVIILP